MKYAALRLIKDEHRSISAVIRATEQIVNNALSTGQAPDFELLYSIMYYLREFPDKRHHVNEDRVLFPRIKARTHEADSIIAQLEIDHRRGDLMLQNLRLGLANWKAGAEGGARHFANPLADYAHFYWTHMDKEETEVLPIAERVLTSEDWNAIHASFELNADPMYGSDIANEFRDLFSRIIRNVPATEPGT